MISKPRRLDSCKVFAMRVGNSIRWSSDHRAAIGGRKRRPAGRVAISNRQRYNGREDLVWPSRVGVSRRQECRRSPRIGRSCPGDRPLAPGLPRWRMAPSTVIDIDAHTVPRQFYRLKITKYLYIAALRRAGRGVHDDCVSSKLALAKPRRTAIGQAAHRAPAHPRHRTGPRP